MTGPADFIDRAHWRRLIALLAVIACHALLYLSLRDTMQQARTPEPPARTVALRLLPWPAAPPPAAREAAAVAKPAPRIAPAPIDMQAPHGTRLPVPLGSRIQIEPLPGVALPASQPPRALELGLPRGYATRPGARNPALDDPRGNTARTTPEQRLARTLDTRVIEEDLGDGRRRIRQGDSCVIVRPSRIGQLMPFNEAAARSPALVGDCP